MKRQELELEAKARLGSEVFEEIRQWYLTTLQPQWDYVVYIVQRSYLLALIMEKIIGEEMWDSQRFMTDAAIMLQSIKLAEYYRDEGKFPSILLCDYILIHGRNINHFIERLEQSLIDILVGYDEERIRDDLADAIKIYVYTRSDDSLLLLGRYLLKLDFVRREPPVFWHKLSNDISSLIVNSGMANASYIYSDWVTEEQYEKMDLSRFICTSYQRIKQYALVHFIGEAEQVKAVYTLRLIHNKYGGCRILPFVMLPNLDHDESWKLLLYVIERMQKAGFSQRECQMVYDWEKMPGMRSLNELLTLILSSAFLREYEKKNGIEIDQKESGKEICKLIRNYNQSGWEETGTFLKKIVNTSLFSTEEIEAVLLDAISDKRKMFSLSGNCGHESGMEEQWKIVSEMEKCFYNLGRQEELEACELLRKAYFKDSVCSKRTARGCCFLLNELASSYNEEQAKYMIAYFLQMMDAGVLSVSSYAPSRVRVVGFAQYAKAGEQSLMLLILQMFEYIPLLAKIQDYSEFRGNTISDEMDEYAKSKSCDLEKDVIDHLNTFVEVLNRIGETPKDWDKNYSYKLDDEYYIQKEGKKDITDYMRQQSGHVKSYLRYVREECPI